MKVVLQSEGQEAFILEAPDGGYFLFDRRLMKSFGPSSKRQFTRHGLWFPFVGSADRVLELFERAETLPLDASKDT